MVIDQVEPVFEFRVVRQADAKERGGPEAGALL